MRTTRLLTTLLLGLGLAVTPAAGTLAAPPDDTVPTLTVTGVTWPTFYPAPDRYKDTVEVSYTYSDEVDTLLDIHLEITDAADQLVLERVDQLGSPGSAGFGWDGRDGSGTALPAGDYTLTFWATDAAGNTSPTDARTVTLDRGKLVTRTYRRDIRAKRSVVERDVRRCSTMPSPVRGWEGSLGYYSNTRCNAEGTPSVAATVNGIYVPRAFKDKDYGSFYRSVVVKTWGGNARNRAGSKAVLQYWNRRRSTWYADRIMGSRLTSHAGRTTAAAPMIHANDGKPYIIWSLLTANGHWYDVKKFSVVMKYQVMKQPASREQAPVLTAPTGVAVTAPQLP